jgi:hypothetical protein
MEKTLDYFKVGTYDIFDIGRFDYSELDNLLNDLDKSGKLGDYSYRGESLLKGDSRYVFINILNRKAGSKRRSRVDTLSYGDALNFFRNL